MYYCTRRQLTPQSPTETQTKTASCRHQYIGENTGTRITTRSQNSAQNDFFLAKEGRSRATRTHAFPAQGRAFLPLHTRAYGSAPTSTRGGERRENSRRGYNTVNNGRKGKNYAQRKTLAKIDSKYEIKHRELLPSFSQRVKGGSLASEPPPKHR